MGDNSAALSDSLATRAAELEILQDALDNIDTQSMSAAESKSIQHKLEDAIAANEDIKGFKSFIESNTVVDASNSQPFSQKQDLRQNEYKRESLDQALKLFNKDGTLTKDVIAAQDYKVTGDIQKEMYGELQAMLAKNQAVRNQ
ncbi:MAG: hypothetical protein ABWY08_16845 [Comamonas sp.]